MISLSHDKDISSLNANNVPLVDVQGPITRARARQLNLQVSSFLGSYFANMENRLLPNDVLMLRNLGDVVEPVGGRLDEERGFALDYSVKNSFAV